jgi:hypothetical protein
MQQTFFASLVKDKEKDKKKVEDFVIGPEGFKPSPQTCTMAYGVQVVLGGLQTHFRLDYEPG